MHFLIMDQEHVEREGLECQPWSRSYLGSNPRFTTYLTAYPWASDLSSKPWFPPL